MQVDLSNSEYNYLLGFYIQLLNFQPWTSTFQNLTDSERTELLLTISVLQRKLTEILPKVQDREAINK